MTAGAAEPAGRASSSREYALCLALGAAGAVIVLLAVRQGWARVLTVAPSPLPVTSVTVTGQDLVPVAGALGLASLAGLAAVIATRRRLRRLTGVLLAAFGMIMAVSMAMSLGTASVLAAARAAAVSHGGSAIAGGPSGPAAVPGGPAAGVGGSAHVSLAGFGWRPVALAGALAVFAAGLLVAWRGGRWPSMSSRYDQPGGKAAARGTDAAALWEALSEGADPTDSATRGPGA